MRVTLIVAVLLAVGTLVLAGCHPHHWPHHGRVTARVTEAAGGRHGAIPSVIR